MNAEHSDHQGNIRKFQFTPIRPAIYLLKFEDDPGFIGKYGVDKWQWMRLTDVRKFGETLCPIGTLFPYMTNESFIRDFWKLNGILGKHPEMKPVFTWAMMNEDRQFLHLMWDEESLMKASPDFNHTDIYVCATWGDRVLRAVMGGCVGEMSVFEQGAACVPVNVWKPYGKNSWKELLGFPVNRFDHLIEP